MRPVFFFFIRYVYIQVQIFNTVSMYSWRAHENVSFFECVENLIYSFGRDVKIDLYATTIFIECQ